MSTVDLVRIRPADAVELCAAVADTTASHPRLLVTGAGTAAGWGGVAEPADAVLDTTALTGTLAYNPADMTVAVRAGTPLPMLQAELAAHGQRVAFDAARCAGGATVGGLLATADGGPARQAYGTLRDLVIGVTVVLADGTLARSGGHVIKNVAGYDLAKLFHGSLGTLGVVVEVVLRLHPMPRAAASVAVPCTLGDAAELGTAVLAAGLEPAALEWTSGRLWVRLEGTQAGVRERADGVAGLARGATGGVVTDRGVTGGVEPWEAVAALAVGEAGDTVVRAGTRPSDGPWFGGRVSELAAEHGVDAAVSSSVGIGVHTVRMRGGEHRSLLGALRDDVAARGGATTVLRRDGLADDVPAWGAPPPAVAVMRAVKQRFDPDGRFGSGRFAPWF